MADKDFHIFALPEQMRLDLMSNEQRWMYGIQKRINKPSVLITQLARIVNDAARPQGSRSLAEQMGVKRG